MRLSTVGMGCGRLVTKVLAQPAPTATTCMGLLLAIREDWFYCHAEKLARFITTLPHECSILLTARCHLPEHFPHLPRAYKLIKEARLALMRQPCSRASDCYGALLYEQKDTPGEQEADNTQDGGEDGPRLQAILDRQAQVLRDDPETGVVDVREP